MRTLPFFLGLLLSFFIVNPVQSQSYYYGDGDFNPDIPSPEEFLGYPIGERHTRHDLVVAYFNKLDELSNRASIEVYGQSYEYRELVMLTVSSPENIENISTIKENHKKLVDINTKVEDFGDMPVLVNLGYSIHGNEPSTTEAAMLIAYNFVASNTQEALSLLDDAVLFIDPAINPDGRDRFTHWANTHVGNVKIADRYDVEHNEAWPGGRTNHYWFDLNRDWYLGVHPESRAKLKWYHDWYPNVVGDFHEMGTNSTYFFEPMKANASKDPIMPKENYTTLTDLFANHFIKDLNEIGSLYFTKEIFDGTYPGYGSSYPDLQGALALLFEQGSSRGHLQETETGEMSFAFTIKNQYVTSLSTVRAAVENKEVMHKYLQDFFTSAVSNSSKSQVKGYVFGEDYDKGRLNGFIDKLLLHKVRFHELSSPITKNGRTFWPGKAYVVPTQQPQYRMVQSFFETYEEYADSVYYDASSWSMVNFYNLKYEALTGSLNLGEEVNSQPVFDPEKLKLADYAYLIPWDDYFAPAVLYGILDNDITVKSAFKPFTIPAYGKEVSFGYGALMIPVSEQEKSNEQVKSILGELSQKFKVPVIPVQTGYSLEGIDLGSRNFRTLKKPKAIMFVGNGISSYEAGEVWHLLDTRIEMPLTKAPLRIFNRVDLDRYNVMVMVSGSYSQLDSVKRQKIADWVKKGNTLITSRMASKWVIDKKIVKESLVKAPKDTTNKNKRLDYVSAREHIGKERVGGSIFEIDLDITHPLGFGYYDRKIPVYRNHTVWLKPSKNPYSTVGKYTKDPHIDGFITKRNLENFLKPSASLIVSPLGAGRVVMFADNPNFRGTWYGTNRMFLNAIFFGKHISVPGGRN
ncbi:MAG: M14 family zinc carboxypeptidase [Bacteroidota bacterium]